MRRWRLLPLLIALSVQHAANAGNVCILPTTIDPVKSPISLDGQVTSPISGDISSEGPASITGTLTIVFPQEACPTPAELPQALEGAYVATPTGQPGIATSPATIKAVVSIGGLIGNAASVNLEGFQGSVAGTPSNFNVAVTGGTAVVDSMLLNVEPLQLQGSTFPGTGCALAAAPGGAGAVQVSCPQLRISVNINAGGAQTNLAITGQLEASGDLSNATVVPSASVGPGPTPGPAPGAPGAAQPPSPAPPPLAPSSPNVLGFLPFCIPIIRIGNCSPPPAPAPAPAPVPAPVPAAPGPSSVLAGAENASAPARAAPVTAVPAVSTTLGPALAQSLAGSGGARCVAGSVATAGGTCTCAEGWTGRSCMQCRNDEACRAFTGAPDSTCTSGMGYSTNSTYKAYNCTIDGGLSQLVSGIAGFCNVRGAPLPFEAGVLLGLPRGGLLNDSGAASAADNKFCRLVVDLAQEPTNPLVCTATGCGFSEGSSSFSCASTECSCPATGRCNELIEGVTRNLKGAAIALDCDPAGLCTIRGMQPQLQVRCTAGECTNPAAGAALLDAPPVAPPEPFPVVAVLSALPAAVLCLLAAAGLAYMASYREYFASSMAAAAAATTAAAATPGKSGGGGGAAAAAAAGGASAAGAAVLGAHHRLLPDEAAGLPLAFVFDSIYCAVPLRGGGGGAATSSAAAATPAHASGVGARLSDALARRRRRGAASAGGASGGAAAASPEPGLLPLSTRAASFDADGVAAAAGQPPPDPVQSYQYDPAGRRILLHHVSGCAREGEVFGVMGPSGCGKTTLLSILSGSLDSIARNSTLGGRVTLGGESHARTLRKVTAYVPQKDVLLPALTVEECLRYSALLRLPKTMSAAQVSQRVGGVLRELGLGRIAASKVGGAAGIRGISGGERRRVSIGMELVTAPKLVILDEPTSGLDSFTAFKLMATSKDIASHGRVVLMSLHQPSPDMFSQLDTVLLLARGHAVYSGPPSMVASYFAAAGAPCPPARPVAEHMLHAVSEAASLAALLCSAREHGAGAAPAAAAAAREDDAAARDQGPLGEGVLISGRRQSRPLGEGAEADQADGLEAGLVVATAGGSSDGGSSGGGGGGGGSDGSPHARVRVAVAPGRGSGAAAPPKKGVRYACAAQAREFAVLFWRTLTDVRRGPTMAVLHLGVALIMGLLVGLIFFQLDDTNVGVQNSLGCIFFSLALFGFTSLTVVDSLVLERELVARETRGRFYGIASYLTSKLVLDGLLLRTLPAVLFTAIAYPMVGFTPEASRIVTFMFVLATYSCTVGALAVAMAALCRTSSATVLAMNIILLMWVMLGGFLVNPASIPAWIRWVRYLCPMSYALEAMASNEMADQYYSIQVDGFPSVGGVQGSVFLTTLGLNPDNTLADVGALVAFYAGTVLLAFALYAFGMWRHTGHRGLAAGAPSGGGRARGLTKARGE